jgi:hypothetical protein
MAVSLFPPVAGGSSGGGGAASWITVNSTTARILAPFTPGFYKASAILQTQTGTPSVNAVVVVFKNGPTTITTVTLQDSDTGNGRGPIEFTFPVDTAGTSIEVTSSQNIYIGIEALGSSLTPSQSIVADQYSTSQNVTIPADVLGVMLLGGGGAGGSSGSAYGFSGGGGSGYFASSTSIGSGIYSLVVGAGGQPGNASSTGGTGGTSTFDTLTATGGKGGVHSGLGGDGGSGGGGGGSSRDQPGNAGGANGLQGLPGGAPSGNVFAGGFGSNLAVPATIPIQSVGGVALGALTGGGGGGFYGGGAGGGSASNNFANGSGGSPGNAMGGGGGGAANRDSGSGLRQGGIGANGGLVVARWA